MGNSFIFQFLYINVLNYRYLQTYCSTFLKIKKTVGKTKTKTFKTRFYRKKTS